MGDSKTLVAALRIQARKEPDSLIAEAVQYIDKLQKDNASLDAARIEAESKLVEFLGNDDRVALVACKAVLRVVGERPEDPEAGYKLTRAQVALMSIKVLEDYGED